MARKDEEINMIKANDFCMGAKNYNWTQATL